MDKGLYRHILDKKANKKKSFAVLIDPDKSSSDAIDKIVALSVASKVDYFFVGGSLVVEDRLNICIQQIKRLCSIPIILFPGSPAQVSKYADGLFFLSLISGRNPDLLIGQHVLSAPIIKTYPIEIIPTGYMVIDGGRPTSVSYISGTTPIPADKSDIAMCTALAGEMLGLKLLYMDAGSGAKQPISATMIQRVAQSVQIPLVVGGGITSAAKAVENCQAGADIIVVGNAIEKEVGLIAEIASAVHDFK